MNRLQAVSLLVILFVGCTQSTDGASSSSGTAVRGDGYSQIVALDERSLLVTFSRTLDKGTVTKERFRIHDRTVVPFVTVSVDGAQAGDADVTLTTTPMEAGRTYTLSMEGLKDAQGNALDGTLNFTGGGAQGRATVTFTVDDPQRATAWGALALDVTADPDSGLFTERVRRVPLQSMGSAFTASVAVVVDTRRTLDRRDDSDPAVDRRAYAVRVVTSEGGLAASPLIPFEVTSAQAVSLALTLLDPPTIPVGPNQDFDPPEDTNPADGTKRIRIIVDDRLPRELAAPAVKLFFDADGNFDLINARTVPLEQPVEPRLYELTVNVKVDPARTLEGMDEATLPYIAFLVNDGQEIDAINVSMLAQDETPQAVIIPLGDATRTPVTFRIDTSRTYLTPDGAMRGVFAGESVFLTGEWQAAADALGRNAGDAFSGGEQRTLEMKPDPDHAGHWFKTIWLTAGRPYGWKVVRCQSGIGCGPLNQLVASSGRAFPTVMKNLATENRDAFEHPEVLIVDPANPSAGALDYTNASIHVGDGMGGVENPPWAPRADTLFKQEVPDLAVVVGNDPIVTPIFTVGTWRDVNTPIRPQQILQDMSPLNITPYDYDQGFIGRYPPSRSAP